MASRAITMWVAAIIPLAAVAASSPQVNFPLNLQFPPVARIGEAYRFQFASTTFQPDPDMLQYSLIRNPSWLSLNSKNRTLWGTPGAGDSGTATFTIAAAGEAGAVANMESKLLVTDTDPPTTTGNFSQQLSSAGQLSGPGTVILPPSKPFEVQFAFDTFQAAGKRLSYRATLADHTPLPVWISFDVSSLRFAGTTPPLNSSPQSYEVLLIASDTPDYAAASISFTLVVSNHQLFFRPLQQTINISKGEHVRISSLREKLFLDNAPIRDKDIQAASAEIPSWLSFNYHTFDISGIPPSGLMSQDISITVEDQFGDMAKHSIHLAFRSQLFTGEIGRLNITAGEPFEYQIPRSILAKDSENISVEFGSLAEWLDFNPVTFTIHGTIPQDFAPQDVQGSLTATSTDSISQDSQTFQLHVSGAGTHVYPGSTAHTGSAQPSETGEVSGRHKPKSRRLAVIVGSVIAAIFGSIVLLAFALLLCRRKRKSKGYISPRSPRSPRKTDISRPIPIEDEWEDVDKAVDQDLEKGEGEHTLLNRTPERPPQLDLTLAMKRKESHSASSSISDGETKILTMFDRSSWGYKDEAGPSHHPHESMKIPTKMARRESEVSSSPTKHKRRTTTVYRDPHRSFGLPANRHLTGLGHGRYTRSPTRSTNNFFTFRRPLSFDSYSTRSISILSTAPSAFPQSPAARHTTQLTTPAKKRRSIRLVATSTCDSLLDRRTIDQKRSSYIRKRASAQSPFFGASSSHVSSSSYKSPPAFIKEAIGSSMAALSPLEPNIVRPNEDVLGEAKRELPTTPRIRKLSNTPSVEAPRVLTGSLRKPPTERSFTQRPIASAAVTRDRVQKQHERPGTAIYARYPVSRRTSPRQSLRAHELKSSLNSLTGSRIFADAEMSESVYSSEEEDIQDYEKRRTVQPNQFTLPPLNPNPLRKSKRSSKSASKQETKRTSQTDLTPYSFTLEHGGKENRSSTYNLETTGSSKPKVTNVSPSPERPKTAIAQRTTRSAYHSQTESHTKNGSSTQRHSKIRPLSHQLSNKSRHSRSQSHQLTTKHGRDRSRIQSSAYPYFDAAILPTTTTDPSKNDKDSATPKKDTTSLLSRGGSGEIGNHALHEDPMMEELGSSSIGFRALNGRVNPSACQSKLAQLTSTHSRSSRRDTAVGPMHTPSHSVSLIGGSPGRADETPGPESGRRTPLSVLDDGNGGSPERLSIMERKGRSISVEMDEPKGRRTWGSLKAVMGRGGWREDRETKAFL